ncbi:hypothetical protein GHT06_011793 [Daphnia sinensis]|uniref:N-acetyltransferase domain-containing protein n=1 Tax=Daphnia sinensis TaxID=1820382 RepID=A0AAD5LF72_9CRUS|nr:hypothetical protein GHT06_011793 [Daphnia sinensis]
MGQENGKDDGVLTLATKQCLFRVLSFLDKRLPEYCAIHSFVCAALVSSDTSYRVYFRRKQLSATSTDDNDFSLIVTASVETCIEPKRQINMKCWTLTAWTDDDDTLADAFEAIDVIDWKVDAAIIHYKHHTPYPAITNFLANKHGPANENRDCYPGDQYYFPIHVALNLQISEMNGVYVKSLETCHAKIVYDHWPYSACTKVEHICKEIELLPSAGVFLKENDQLVSWMMCHPPNGMSRLHTLEDHRRRGYASLVTRYLTKRVAQSGVVPFVNIVIGNTASCKFFDSMGFKHLRPINISYSVP